ncbi:MAG: DNA/RNA helicase domain-containing protein, partial [Bacteroidales bacterium]
MRLYEGSTGQFVDDVLMNELTPKLVGKFKEYYGHKPSPSEVTSWNNSLQYVKNLIEANSLNDNAIALEYELPYTNKRIDCIFFGKNKLGSDNIVVIELKQWSSVEDSEIEGRVYTYINKGLRPVSHPSLQVQGYHNFLKDYVQLFTEDPGINLESCVYCHNYDKKPDDPLFSIKFEKEIKEFPVFTREDFKKLGDYLKERLSGGRGLDLLNKFRKSPIRPSKKLLNYAGKMIKEKQVAFHLLDEQLLANDTILDRAKKASKLKRKSVIIVRGGPGTGKSVIALNIMAELLSKDQQVFHATGSKTFTETVRKIVGSRTSSLFKYFNSFAEKKVKKNQLDVLVCDEAHRIRKTSNYRFTRKNQKSEIPQVDELVRAAKVSVFFIDDYQVVKPVEIGSTELIKKAAKKYDAEVFEFELKTQFRCNGSNGYLDWINNILEIGEPNNKVYLNKEDKFDFRIFDYPAELYSEIKEKNKQKGTTARLVAGFCWPWSRT